MKINFAVRAQNKAFWVAIIPAVLMLVRQVLAVFGVLIDPSDLSTALIKITETVFTILAIMGIIVDPTTEGISDSNRAMTYTAPHRDGGGDEA